MPTHEAWAAEARRLGLALRTSRHPKLLGVEWRRMADALGPPGGASLDHWMAGSVGGREVLAFWGPGLGEAPVDQCRVVVRIDPPLLMGLAIFPTTPDDVEVACNDTHVAAAFADLDPKVAVGLVADAARALAAAVPTLGGPYRG